MTAMDVPTDSYRDDYRRKRDLIYAGLSDLYEVVKPGGAFYIFPKAPNGKGTEFVARAIESQLLMIPGNIFSRHDTHFRISFAASDETLYRAIDALRSLS
jgi:aspartate aminotransferase/aminotransferase